MEDKIEWSLSTYISSIYNKPELSDFCIISENAPKKLDDIPNTRKIYLHKFILRASPYFQKLFSGNFNDSQEYLNVPNLAAADFVCKYIYFGSSYLKTNKPNTDDFLEAGDLFRIWLLPQIDYQVFCRYLDETYAKKVMVDIKSANRLVSEYDAIFEYNNELLKSWVKKFISNNDNKNDKAIIDNINLFHLLDTPEKMALLDRHNAWLARSWHKWFQLEFLKYVKKGGVDKSYSFLSDRQVWMVVQSNEIIEKADLKNMEIKSMYQVLVYDSIIPFKAKLYNILSKNIVKLTDNSVKIVSEMIFNKGDMIELVVGTQYERYIIEKIVSSKDSTEVDVGLSGMQYIVTINGKVDENISIAYLLKEY